MRPVRDERIPLSFTLYTLPFNYEAIVPLVHGPVRFIDGGNARAARALCQSALQFFQSHGISNGVDLHVAVPEVFHVSADAELRGPAIREIAIPDPLYAARNQKLF